MIVNTREKEQRFESFEFWQKLGLCKKTYSVYKYHQKKFSQTELKSLYGLYIPFGHGFSI